MTNPLFGSHTIFLNFSFSRWGYWKRTGNRRCLRHSLSPQVIKPSSQSCSALWTREVFDLSEWLVVSFHTHLRQQQHVQIGKSCGGTTVWNPELGHCNWCSWFSSPKPLRPYPRHGVTHFKSSFPHSFTGSNFACLMEALQSNLFGSA